MSFAQGFSDGVSQARECDAVLRTLEAARTRVASVTPMNEHEAGGSAQQVVAGLEPLLQAYEQSASELSALTLTDSARVQHRDRWVSLYREGAATLRTESRALLEPATGDNAEAAQRVRALGSELEQQEAALRVEFDALCGQGR